MTYTLRVLVVVLNHASEGVHVNTQFLTSHNNLMILSLYLISFAVLPNCTDKKILIEVETK